MRRVNEFASCNINQRIEHIIFFRYGFAPFVLNPGVKFHLLITMRCQNFCSLKFIRFILAPLKSNSYPIVISTPFET